MIIPKTDQSIKIGDTVLTTKLKDIYYCIITQGHEFIVIDTNGGEFICEDKINNLKVNFSVIEITKKIDLEIAKKEYIFRRDFHIYTQEILEKCIQKDYEYSDYERYNTCKLGKGCYNSCNPKLECAKHINKKSKGLLKFLRKVKLEKIECSH